jgi:hypothetical protein
MFQTLKKPKTPVTYVQLAALLLLSACGTPEDRHSSAGNISSPVHVTPGRRVAYDVLKPITKEQFSLFLAEDRPVLALASDAAVKASGWEVYDTQRMPLVASDDLAGYAADYISSQVAVFGVDASDLMPAPNFLTSIDEKMIAVTFLRSHRGIQVKGAYVQLIFQNMGEDNFSLREVVNRSYGQMILQNDDTDEADERALSELAGLRDFNVLAARRIIVPVKDSSERYDFYLGTEFMAADVTNEKITHITIADGNGRVLEIYDDEVPVTKSTLNAMIYARNYLSAATPDPMNNVTVMIGGSKITTDSDGNFTPSTTGNGTITLSNEHVAVFNAGSASAAQVPVTIEDSAVNNIKPTSQEMVFLNSFRAIERIQRFAKRHLAISNASIFTRPIRVNVNSTDGDCNAFYSPNNKSLNFYAASSKCANTALLADVIYHEWGHALDDNIGNQGGITDGAFSEGIGDAVTFMRTGSPELGAGFFFNDSKPIRNAENTARYPDDKGEVHAEGQIIAGALWDLRKGLVDRYGEIKGAYLAEKYFYKHLLTTDSYRDSYQAILRLDDNDGNASTRSPNHCLINKAFANHGLATAEACQDATQKESLKLAPDLYISLASADATGAVIMASSDNAAAATAYICLKPREQCQNPALSELTELPFEGVKGQRRYFLAKGKVDLKVQQEFSVLTADKNGTYLGAKSFKMVEK